MVHPLARRLFAVVPAAGLSRRMKQPKLLMRLGNETVISRLLGALDREEVTERFVVLRQSDEPLQAEIVRAGATPVIPAADPPDMRASVEHALKEIRRRHQPAPDDGWLLVPADHPVLAPAVLDALLARWSAGEDAILVPTFHGRRGHPALFRWRLADEVASIPADRGLNWLVQNHADEVAECSVNDESILIDLDTPGDFDSLVERFGDG